MRRKQSARRVPKKPQEVPSSGALAAEMPVKQAAGPSGAPR